MVSADRHISIVIMSTKDVNGTPYVDNFEKLNLYVVIEPTGRN